MPHKCGRCRARYWEPHSAPASWKAFGFASVALVAVPALGLLMLVRSIPSPPSITAAALLPALAEREPAPERRVDLALLSARWFDGAIGDFRFVVGEVRNTSSEKLDHVDAISTWFDAQHRPVAVESSPLETTPLLPGQVSSFKTMTRVRADLQRFSLTFRTPGGIPLSVEDYSGGDYSGGDGAAPSSPPIP